MEYYMLRSRDKDRIDGNVICLVGPTSLSDIGMKVKPTARMILREMYEVEMVSKSEAESYAELGVAPLVSPSDLGVIHMRYEFRNRGMHSGYFMCITYANTE